MKKQFQFLFLAVLIGYIPMSYAGLSTTQPLQIADSGYIPPPPPPPSSNSFRSSGREGSSSKSYSITCESDDYGRKDCPTNTGGKNVRLKKQLSKTKCVKGNSWGYNSNGIWVDDGCRATFVIDSFREVPNNRSSRIRSDGGSERINQSRQQRISTGKVTCASSDFGYNYCRIRTNNNVRMINQVSESDCIEDKTWGYDKGGIWVDKGCRAEFSLGASSSAINESEDTATRRNRRDHMRTTVTCESDDYDYKHCKAPVWEGSVRLTRQLSNTSCVQGKTWGQNNDGIWVDKGCRAEFAVGR